MTEKDFCMWLNGFFELSETNALSPKQVEIIKQHLSLVFNKVTTSPDDVISWPKYYLTNPPILSQETRTIC